MKNDPRAKFVQKSMRQAQGEQVLDDRDMSWKDLDTEEPRQRFIRDSHMLADGMSMADVRRINMDQENDIELSPRERFIRDSQRLCDPDSASDAKSGKRTRIADARRTSKGHLKAIRAHSF